MHLHITCCFVFIVRRVKQNPFLVCTPLTRGQMTRPPKWLLSATEEHFQPRNRKTITWAVKPHVDRTMLVSLNCERHYRVRLSTKKMSRDILAFSELVSVSRKFTGLAQYFIYCRPLFNSSFQAYLQLARTDTRTTQNVLTLRKRDSFKWASRYLYQFTEHLASKEIKW